MIYTLWKTVWQFLITLNMQIPNDPAIALLDIYSKDTKIQILRGTCTPMFTAAVSTVAKLWKKPRCSPRDEWIKKMCVCVSGMCSPSVCV